MEGISPGLLEAAKQVIPEPDVIIDLYELTFEWVSDKFCEITGMTRNRVINASILGFDKLERGAKRKMISTALTMMSRYKKTNIIPFEREDGKQVKVKTETHYFEYKGGPYVAERILELIE
jgi:hypothetical protein